MLHARRDRGSSVASGQRFEITIFDLDRTLTRRGTYSPFLIHAALRSAPWRLMLVPAVLVCMAGYRLGLISRKTLKEVMQRLLLGSSVPRRRVDALAESFATRLIASGLHVETRSLIAGELAAGRTLILATAAHSFYATTLATRLGITHIVGTQSEWHDGYLAPMIKGENCYGVAKRDAILAGLGELGLSREDVHIRFYSDDRSDLPSFEASDECFVVNPKASLAALADARGWRVLQFR